MNALAERNFVEEGTDARAIFAKVLARRWLVLIIVGLFTGAFTCAAFLMTPFYRATVVLAPATSERGANLVGGIAESALGGLASGLGLTPRDAETEEALAVLHSRDLTERFITRHDLLLKLSRRGLLSRLLGRDQEPTLAKAYKYFDKQIRTILQDKKTGLVTLQIDWMDRNESADWANALVKELNDEMRARAVKRADADMQFLEEELGTTSTVETRQAVSRLMEAQLKQRMLAHVTEDYSFRVVDKAIAAEKDDPVRPQKFLLIIIGLVVGVAVAFVVVLLLDSASARPVPARRNT